MAWPLNTSPSFSYFFKKFFLGGPASDQPCFTQRYGQQDQTIFKQYAIIMHYDDIWDIFGNFSALSVHKSSRLSCLFAFDVILLLTIFAFCHSPFLSFLLGSLFSIGDDLKVQNVNICSDK